MNDNWHPIAFREGEIARMQQELFKARKQNPYKENTWESNSWRAGWADMDMVIMETKNET